MKRKVVISMGGSLLYPKEFDYGYAKKFADLVLEARNDSDMAIVTGGGRLARKFIEITRKTGAKESVSDMVGIKATRINAFLLSTILGKKSEVEIPENIIEAIKIFKKKGVVVMGGTTPGQSTDAVAAEIAEHVNADVFINATNVKGVYDKNPKKHKNAKLYKKLSANDLVEMLSANSTKAGTYELMDIFAARMIQRSKLKTVFLDGHDLKNFRKAIEGEEKNKRFRGTVIC